MPKTKHYAVLSGLAIAGIIALVGWKTFVSTPEHSFAQCDGGASSADIGGPFELVSETGEIVSDADVITEPSLIYFGYTFCPDVCPFDAVRNAEAVEILAERGHSVTPVFITVDPARDTAEVLDDFTANVHEKMVGLTGSEEQIGKAAKAYRAYSKAHNDDDPDYYTVDHSTFTYLVFPEKGFAGFFRRDLSGAELADRVECFLDAGGQG